MRLADFRNKEQPCEGKHTVEQKQLIAKMIAGIFRYVGAQCQTDCWRNDTSEWQTDAARFAFCEDSEGEESEKWSVGVAHEGVDSIDERRGVEGVEE